MFFYYCISSIPYIAGVVCNSDSLYSIEGIKDSYFSNYNRINEFLKYYENEQTQSNFNIKNLSTTYKYNKAEYEIENEDNTLNSKLFLALSKNLWLDNVMLDYEPALGRKTLRKAISTLYNIVFKIENETTYQKNAIAQVVQDFNILITGTYIDLGTFTKFDLYSYAVTADNFFDWLKICYEKKNNITNTPFLNAITNLVFDNKVDLDDNYSLDALWTHCTELNRFVDFLSKNLNETILKIQKSINHSPNKDVICYKFYVLHRLFISIAKLSTLIYQAMDNKHSLYSNERDEIKIMESSVDMENAITACSINILLLCKDVTARKE